MILIIRELWNVVYWAIQCTQHATDTAYLSIVNGTEVLVSIFFKNQFLFKNTMKLIVFEDVLV